jgi:DNA repair exonuclease SbcCD ATPase subunit
MQLSSITLRNFRCHVESRFDLAPVTLFTGDNGSGKSSVAEAIRLALSGKTESLNDRNEGISNLIRRGEQQAEIVLALPNGDSIVRRIPGGLSITGTSSTTNQKDAEARLTLMMGAAPDQARMALGPRLFKLDPKSRKDTLFDLLRLWYTTDDVVAGLEEQGEVAGISLLDLASEVAGSVTNDLSGMEERAREDRRVTKKQLEAEEIRLKDLVAREGQRDDQVSDVPAPDQTQVQKARAEVSRLYGIRVEWERAESELRKAEGRLAEFGAELAGRTAEPEERWQEGQQRLAARRKELQAAEEALQTRRHAEETARGLEEEIQRLRSAFAQAREPKCPTCGGPVNQDEDRLQQIRARGKSLEERLQKTQDATPAGATPEQMEQLRAAVQRGQAWVEEQGRLRWLSGGIQEAQRRLEETQERLAGLERPDPEAQAAAQKHLDELEQRAEWARAWKAHLEQVNATKRRVEALSHRREALDRLCGWLGPHGFRAQILDRRIGPLVNEVNGILQRWGMAIAYEPSTLDLLVTTPRAEEAVPYHLLSDGEQLLVQLAHQAFVSILSGVRILVLDRVEAMDRKVEQKLFRAVFDLVAGDDGLDHVLLMAVDAGTVALPTGVATEAFRRHTLPFEPPAAVAGKKPTARRRTA